MPNTVWERFPCTGITVVALRGEIDIATAPDVYETVVRNTDTTTPPCVVVDLSEVSFMDVSGVRALVRVWTELTRTKRHLAVAGARPPVARVLDALGLKRYFPIYPVVEAALSDHAAARPHSAPRTGSESTGRSTGRR